MSLLPGMAFRGLHDCMSVTKGAIGLAYVIEGVDLDTPLPHASQTIREALCHRGGISDDDGVFDYTGFRQRALEGSALGFSIDALDALGDGDPQSFGYCNVKWQLLTEHFRRLTGKNCSDVVRIGQWETDAAGTCLGPHGLYLSHDDAVALGKLAHKHIKPPPNYAGECWMGWWTKPDGSFVASGYNYQWIHVYPSGDVHVKLNGLAEDFD